MRRPGIIRRIARKYGVSIERVYHLLWNLEAEGKIELKRKKGRYVIRSGELEIIEKELVARQRKRGGKNEAQKLST